MQLSLFGDMSFRSNGMSEDCLYLNVWTPATSAEERLPVLVYFYGGGNLAGDGSEPRYDGASLARRGIVVLRHGSNILDSLDTTPPAPVVGWTRSAATDTPVDLPADTPTRPTSLSVHHASHSAEGDSDRHARHA